MKYEERPRASDAKERRRTRALARFNILTFSQYAAEREFITTDDAEVSYLAYVTRKNVELEALKNG